MGIGQIKTLQSPHEREIWIWSLCTACEICEAAGPHFPPCSKQGLLFSFYFRPLSFPGFSCPYRPSLCRSVEIVNTLLSALPEFGGPDSELWSLGSHGKCPIHSAISTAASLEYTLPGLLYTSD